MKIHSTTTKTMNSRCNKFSKTDGVLIKYNHHKWSASKKLQWVNALLLWTIYMNTKCSKFSKLSQDRDNIKWPNRSFLFVTISSNFKSCPIICLKWIPQPSSPDIFSSYANDGLFPTCLLGQFTDHVTTQNSITNSHRQTSFYANTATTTGIVVV